jgi:quinolinate synthase
LENPDAALIEKIESLKKRRNAIILAHNYQLGEVQDIADFVGDTLELIQKAAATDADVIIFCGVLCIAETAAIACPDKVVILPDMNAGCTLANMITAERLREKKERYPGATILCYINTPAAVKAESDICYSASSAVRTVEKMPADKEIMFIPDQYLGDYVATQTGRELILWPGYCSTHIKIRPEDIAAQKEEHPEAKVIVHMECIPQVKALADAVSGTAGIIKFARETGAREIIVGTETGILHRLRKENPGRIFIAATERAICATMKIISLETVLWSLENMGPQIEIPEEIRLKAKPAVDKMLEGSEINTRL